MRLSLRLMDAIALTSISAGASLFVRAGRSWNRVSNGLNALGAGTSIDVHLGHYLAQCKVAAILVSLGLVMACASWWRQRTLQRGFYRLPRR